MTVMQARQLHGRQVASKAFQPFVPRQPVHKVVCRASGSQQCSAGQQMQRRQVLQLFSAAAATQLILPRTADAAKSPYTTVKDAQDGYEFVYPYGWQEVTVKGQDIVFKDVIEPLESVSVSITATEKKTIEEFGSPAEVAVTLATNVLTPPNQEVKILNVSERDNDGRKYYEFEFASKAKSYIRHALAVVTVGNGKLYTLATGANERRWGKMKDRLEEVVKSMYVSDRYVS